MVSNVQVPEGLTVDDFDTRIDRENNSNGLFFITMAFNEFPWAFLQTIIPLAEPERIHTDFSIIGKGQPFEVSHLLLKIFDSELPLLEGENESDRTIDLDALASEYEYHTGHNLHDLMAARQILTDYLTESGLWIELLRQTELGDNIVRVDQDETINTMLPFMRSIVRSLV